MTLSELAVERLCLFSTPYGSKDICSPHGEHKSSGPRPVKLCLDK